MRLSQRLGSVALAIAMSASFLMPLSAGATSSASLENSDFSTYSAEQLQSLITKLQRYLEEAKKGTPCFVSNDELSLGDGEDGAMTDSVRRLQEFLKEKGLISYKSTGYFGKMTRAAVIAFQRQQGIDQSGVFDAATRAKAHAMACKNVVAKKVTTEEKKKSEAPQQTGLVKSIMLQMAGGKAYWKVDGYSKMGFKVVWSKNPSPTYPNRDSDRYIYLDNPNSGDARLEAFSGSGTYYVRVCEYLGGACGVYSNEVSVQL